MSVLTVNERLNGSTETSIYLQITRPNLQGEKIRQRITSRLLPKVSSATQNRNEKILNIRHQLDACTYNIKERLDMAADRLIENLII
jgi:ABC-type uncharacterized transport system involved in gliding motility auxiliary subunit